jgi:hypothetical protein
VDHESRAGKESRTNGDDFEFALGQAENLLQRVEHERDVVRYGRTAQVIVPVLVALSLTLIIGTHALSAARTLVIVVVCILIMAPIVTWIEVALIGPARRRASRDERAMLDIIGMLRELQVSVAADGHWSAGRQRLTKARIARFPIGSRGFR